MPITDWPIQERPREKLLTHGANNLSLAELLAIFIRTGIRGYTALDIARQAVKQFGGLRPLLEADLNTFKQVKGFSTTKYVELQAALELGRRYLETPLQRQGVLSNTQATRRYLTAKLRHQTHEVFAVLSLDNQHRVIDYSELFFGTINQAIVHPRVVIKHVLQHNAASIILAHNHPSGSIEPSLADHDVTREIQMALRYLDINVLDHIIVGDSSCYSFAETGLL